jgi:hypothetical protein
MRKKMTKTVTSLTEEQEAKMPYYRDKWINIGLKTTPNGVEFDRKAAEQSIGRMYKSAGYKEPTVYLHEKDPLQGAIKAAQIKKFGYNPEDVYEYPGKEKVLEQLYKCCYGNQSSWLSYFDYFGECVGLECCNKLNGVMEAANHCGWFWTFEDLAIITPFPETIIRDDDYRLHHDSQPALNYRDGLEVFAWHGIRVEKVWITDPKSIDIDDCFHWENIEQRRCLCEIVGWENVLEKSEYKTIHEDGYGVLIETNSPATAGEAARFVIVVNPTDGRKFVLPVPLEIERAKQGVAWTYDMEEDEYDPEIRT